MLQLRSAVLQGPPRPRGGRVLVVRGQEGLVQQIVTFFQTKKPPIPPEETIELMGFMEAADDSKRQGGKPVPLPKYTLD